MERHKEWAQTVLRKELVAVLKIGLSSANLSLEDREQSWASRLEEMELRSAMCFLPSAAKLSVGHLLLGSSPSFQYESTAGPSNTTGAGVNQETSEAQPTSKESSPSTTSSTAPTSDSTTSTKSPILTSASTTIDQKWSAGSCCLARCPDDGTWKRAKVVSQDSVRGDVGVMLIDYSESVMVGVDDLVSSVDELSDEERKLVDKVVWVANAVKDLKQVEVNKSKVVVSGAGDVDVAINPSIGQNPYSVTKVEAALDDDSLLVENSQSPTLPAEEIICDRSQLAEDNFGLGVSVGQDCVAKWSEDNVWYRAQVAEVGQDGKLFVVFTDYGNSAYVEEGGLVTKEENIPEGEEKDVHLVGAADAGHLYDRSEEKDLQVADGDIVEEKYAKSEYAETAVDDLKEVGKVEENEQGEGISNQSRFRIGDICVAQFSEDNVW